VVRGATFDFDRFLDERGILILDGSSRGNLSRDAAAIMMGAIVLRVIRHCRTGARSRVVLVLDEAVNANLIGLHESQALSEAGKWGLQFHMLVQDPLSFPTPEIRSNVLQNCGRHEWFRQGSPEAARLAAEDIATPLLDPLQVHHTEYRVREAEAGYDRIRTTSTSTWHDPSGHTGKGTSWSTVLRARRRAVKDAQDRYTALNDQVLLIQKEMMRLRPGLRFVRGTDVTPVPEDVPMLSDPWSAFDGEVGAMETAGGGLAEVRLRDILGARRERPMFRAPAIPGAPRPAASVSQAAARRLAGRKEG